MKIALVHDSFTQEGGAERVFEALHELYPGAPVFALVLDSKLKGKYKTWNVKVSWLQFFYNLFPRLKWWLPLIPFAVSSLNFSGFDVIISSSSGFVKNIEVPKSAKHICYCHTPPRFLWHDKDYVAQEVPKILTWLVKPVLWYLKKWDLKASSSVTLFLANSIEVQKRIKQIYNRDSIVVYPFVDTNFWQPSKETADYFLLGGRLQPHKHNELIVKIFNELGLKLKVFGSGRQEKYLRSIAKPNIEFLGKITDEQLRDLYSGSLGLIYPQVEDFGLMPLEATACGTPSMALGQGGSLETIVPNKTGAFFYRYNEQEIMSLINTWKKDAYKKEDLLNQAKKFSKENFTNSIREILQNEHSS